MSGPADDEVARKLHAIGESIQRLREALDRQQKALDAIRHAIDTSVEPESSPEPPQRREGANGWCIATSMTRDARSAR